MSVEGPRMSVEGLRLPGCPANAWHRDYAPHVFFCDLPLGHDGKHGQETSPGVWVHWDITMDFGATAPPANPADTHPVDPDNLIAVSGWSTPASQFYDLTGQEER